MPELNKGFFSVDLEQFHKAAGLGMAEACLYLIYCCGSGKSNDKTSWSVNALNNHTGLKSARKGKLSAERLQEAGLTKQLKGGKHPQFQIIQLKDSEKVWLPNTFVTGTGDEVAPIERLRRTGDIVVLRLLLTLYARCNIADDGGVQTDIIFTDYVRKKIGSYKHFNIFGFNKNGQSVYSNKLFDFLTEKEQIATRADIAGADLGTFWERFNTLQHSGLIYEVPTLFDSENGEPIVALKDPFTLEYNNDLDMLNERLSVDNIRQNYDYCLPVPKAYANATLKGVYVPRYRQHTALVAAGYAENQNRLNDYVEILCSAHYSDKDINDSDNQDSLSAIH